MMNSAMIDFFVIFLIHKIVENFVIAVVMGFTNSIHVFDKFIS